MPDHWEKLIKASGITKQDQEKNAQAIIDVIGFMTESERQKTENNAFTKFAYRENDAPPPITVVDGDSPTGSPVLPKRPSIPTKPPRKISSTNAPSVGTNVSPSSKPAASPNNPPPPVPARPERSVGSVSPEKVLPSNEVVKPPVPPKPNSKQLNSKPVPPTQNEPAVQTQGPKVRTRQKQDSDKDDVIARLKLLCNPQNPKEIYHDFKKIGQGASGGVYIAKYTDLGLPVAIKQMDLDKQPKKELIINEIVVMNSAKHKNIVNYIDSFLVGNVLWVVMEFMEGGSLTETATINFMTDEHISIVCREVLQGLEHLHSKEIIHRDIKSDNVLLGLDGQIKLSKTF